MPGNLRTGLVLLASLALLALGAPWIATDAPWLARGPDGDLVLPAWSGGPTPDPRLAAPDPLVRAPVPHRPNTLDLHRQLEPPSRDHPLGTDGLGRDLAARIVYGARVSMAVGMLSALLALAVGIPLGAVAGYVGGVADGIVTRVTETVLCFPPLLLLLAILAAPPTWLDGLSDVVRIALVLAVTGWIPVSRYLRGEFMRLAGGDVVSAARAAGAGHLRIVLRHILPAAMAPVLVTAAFAVAGAISLEASLSFLGLGVRPPTPSWGGLLNEARTHVTREWWLVVFPGVALFTALLGCNLVGEGVRDFLDPRSRSR